MFLLQGYLIGQTLQILCVSVSVSVSCRISVPQPGIEPTPLQWKPRVLTPGTVPVSPYVASSEKAPRTPALPKAALILPLSVFSCWVIFLQWTHPLQIFCCLLPHFGCKLCENRGFVLPSAMSPAPRTAPSTYQDSRNMDIYQKSVDKLILFFFVKTIWYDLVATFLRTFGPEQLWKWSVSCSIVSDSLGMDGSLPGSSIHGILQARILEWTAMPFSRGSSPPSSPALQANSLPPEPPGSLRITLVVSKYQTVVQGKDGIVKIHQVPHVWTFKAVDKCSHVRSREWVRESGVPRRLCAASTSAGSCVLPSQRGTENSGAVLSFQAHDFQKQVQKLQWCSRYPFQGTAL